MAVNWGMPTPDTGSANGAGAHAHLDGLHARLDEIGCPFRRNHVAGHDGTVRQLAEVGNHVHHAGRVSCGGVNEQGVRSGGNQGFGSVQIIGADTHGGAAAQVAVFILGSVCKHGALLDIRFRDKAGQHAVFIHQRKLFNAVGVKDVARFLNGRGGSCRNQAGKGGHYVLDPDILVIVHAAHVAAGDDAFQLAVGIHDGEAGVTLIHHDLVDFFQRHVLVDRDGVRDDRVFKTLHAGNHGRLDVNGVVAVDDGQAAFPRQGNRQFRFGNGIHGRGQHGNFHVKAGNKLGTDVRIAGKNRAQAGQQEHVIKT